MAEGSTSGAGDASDASGAAKAAVPLVQGVEAEAEPWYLSLTLWRMVVGVMIVLMGATYGYAQYLLHTTTPEVLLVMAVDVGDARAAEVLEESLPEWAQLADYWLVGLPGGREGSVRAAEVARVVEYHLDHLPGALIDLPAEGETDEAVAVESRPTPLGLLVADGIERFPQAHYGMLARHDWVPFEPEKLRKARWARTCVSHPALLWEYDYRRGERASAPYRRELVYRNVAGAEVWFRGRPTLSPADAADPAHADLRLEACHAVDSRRAERATPELKIEHWRPAADGAGSEAAREARWRREAERTAELLEADAAAHPEWPELHFEAGAAYEPLARDEAEGTRLIEATVRNYQAFVEAVADPPTSEGYAPVVGSGADLGRREQLWRALTALGDLHFAHFSAPAAAYPYWRRSTLVLPGRLDGHLRLGRAMLDGATSAGGGKADGKAASEALLALQRAAALEPLAGEELRAIGAASGEALRTRLHGMSGMYECIAPLEYAAALAGAVRRSPKKRLPKGHLDSAEAALARAEQWCDGGDGPAMVADAALALRPACDKARRARERQEHARRMDELGEL